MYASSVWKHIRRKQRAALACVVGTHAEGTHVAGAPVSGIYVAGTHAAGAYVAIG